MSIGEKIVEARKANNMTQEQLAELMGVTRQSVSRWEQNQAYPEIEKILRLSDILNVSCDYLLKENETRKNGNVIDKENQSMVTRLLKGLVGKKAKIYLLDGDIDINYLGEVCEILELEGEFMKISYVNHLKQKKVEVNLIDVVRIAFLELVED